VQGLPDVVESHSIRTRGLESQVCVDLHLLVVPDTTVENGHEVAPEAEDLLRRRFRQIADVGTS
jgi:divalent metal cation (Fe/Co/Zn/Cd) transporter